MPAAYINIIDFSLARNEITNVQLASEYPDYTADSIYKNSGVLKRFSVDKGCVCTDFAAENVSELLNKHKIDKHKIDFLIYCTEAPDYIAPASSVVLHGKLGLSKEAGTFDLQFGCSGYTYGLLLAKALIESSAASTILFVTADIPTQVISEKDPHLRFLFSDAVSISIISSEKKGYKLGEFIKGTDGKGETALRVINSGFNSPRNEEWYHQEGNENLSVGRMEMDGEAVFRFSVDVVAKIVEEVLNKNKLKREDIDLFVFHQASRIILKSLQRKLKIEEEKIYNNLERVGNTVSASIPVALSQALSENRITKNMNIMVVGFGIGFSWSATVFNTTNL